MRACLLFTLLLLAGCGPRLEFNASQEMTPAQMLERSTHVFLGVIERHQLVNWSFLRAPNNAEGHWKVARRRVRVEAVLRGKEPHQSVDVFEIYWTGGATGNWNSTRDNERYLFLVRQEHGRYHVVRDWWRSIHSVGSGRHDRLPLTDAHPFWERVALMMWQVKPGHGSRFADTSSNDPGRVLSLWRVNKILRGLLRHPERNVRLAACEELLHGSMAQDECWDAFSSEDRYLLNRFHNAIPPGDAWSQNRRFESRGDAIWAREIAIAKDSGGKIDEFAMEQLRLLTTIRDPKLRQRFCMLFQQQFPQETEHGCPADQPRPATIVTDDGDVPLKGEWPKF